MESLNKQAPADTRFTTYAFVQNRTYCLTILSLMIVQYIFFKQLYPYPDFFSDSYSYIAASILHLNVNVWPIGYSRFLSYFPFLTRHAPALVFFQYFAYALSALYFYLTVTYFYTTGKSTRIVLCLFLFFSPMLLFLTNYITSDMLFLSLSLCWLVQLIWILNRPRLYQVFTHAGLVFVLFTFRYNAMLYPLIGVGVFLISKQKLWVKLLGLVLGPLLVLWFIVWSGNAAKELTGTAQFPPILGGWQWANNALYIRPYIYEDSIAFPSAETTELDRLARQYFAHLPSAKEQVASLGNFFIRKQTAPLKQYMLRHYGVKHEVESIANWGRAAVVFDQYGKFLIRRHPWAFIQYYMIPNTKRYFVPPVDLFGLYNLGTEEMWPVGQRWFQYNNPRMWCISKDLQGTILFPYPWLFLLFNIYYFVVLFFFILKVGFRKTTNPVGYTIFAVTAFLLLNFAFSIFANSIVIRYQVFPMLVLLCFAMLVTDYLEIFLWNSKNPPPGISSHYNTISSF